MSDCQAAIPVASTLADAPDVTETDVERLQRCYGHLAAGSLLRATIEVEFPGRIAVVSSFGAEAAVILALVAEIDPATPVIFLDTGKHFAETLAYRDRLTAHLGLTDVRSIRPLAADLTSADADGRLWERDADACCHFRKVVPLERALAGFDAWITGRKRFHSGERADLDAIETVDSRIKINPLANWSVSQIASEFKARRLPRHPLVAHGYPSIGCAPCTSRDAGDGSARGGRWIGADKTECGIHRAKWARGDRVPMQEPMATKSAGT
jgi:phosphoadenosine phosphosulfate reductase